jgi:hypothetical protein
LPLLTELAQAVADELSNEQFFGQKHYDRNTYFNGCRGPLCTKSERDRAAKKYAERNPNRKVRPRRPEDIARDAYLDTVLSIYKPNPKPEVEASAG